MRLSPVSTGTGRAVGGFASVAALTALVLGSAGCNQPIDYPPLALDQLGLHQAPQYLARDLLPARGVTELLLHPRMGQAAIRRGGEPFDVSYIGGLGVQVLLDGDGPSPAPLPVNNLTCDVDGICAGTAQAPFALGLHTVCTQRGGAAPVCSPAALDIVAAYHDPALVADISDMHVGDGDSLAGWGHVVDALNALDPPPDLVIFSGDGADTGEETQRQGFLSQLVRLQLPSFVVTGNHDMDNGGLDGFLLEVEGELDYQAHYGNLRLVGLSTGQDLDDGHHLGRLSDSGGPDASQLAWLATALDGDDPTIVFFHHPLYNGLFGTVGPARDALLNLVTRDAVRAVLVGHVHITEVYDRDGENRGLSTASDTVAPERWPLHYTCSRSTNYGDGYALLHIGQERVDYRWVGLGD